MSSRSGDLSLAGDRLSFYIRPADGFELPAIMKWLKQTFAQRYNRDSGRTGHLWGDRYWSRILEGELPDTRRREARRPVGSDPAAGNASPDTRRQGARRPTAGSDPTAGNGRPGPRFSACSPFPPYRPPDKRHNPPGEPQPPPFPPQT
ncbi:MAG: hypothetical protein LBO04_06130 [Spirochaetaceae bacterium]|nr:hypothetical protein [Spirochaetaceae bacterium]